MHISMTPSTRTCFSFAIIVLGLLVQNFANAQQTEIKVAIFYTTSAKSHYNNIETDFIAIIESQLNSVFDDSDLLIHFTVVGHREITHSGPDLVDEDEFSLQNMAELSHDTTAAKKLTTSAGESINDLRVALEADVVFMVYDEDKTEKGGGVAGPWTFDDTAPFPRPGQYLISITDLIAIDNTSTSAHEMGHIFGCRHENSDDPGIFPFPNCHGFISADGKFATIMSTLDSCLFPDCKILALFSNKNEEIVDEAGVGHGMRGDDEANAVEQIATGAASVSTYGDNLMPPPSPPTVPAFCDPTPQFLGCSGPGIAKWAATWNAPSGAEIIEYILEIDDDNNGSFVEAYRGELEGLTCPAPGSTDRLVYRVAYRTITGTSPYCPTVNVYHNCPDPNEGGGGGPPP